MHNCVDYLLTTPWPNVGKQPGDRALVRQLFSVYGGPRGQLTAASQYFYNALLTHADGLTDLSDLFACAAHAETRHLEKLGELILLYGGDPRLLSYRSSQPQWWSGGNVRYVSDPRVMLRDALSLEREMAAAYRALAAQMAAAPRALMERMQADVQHHIALFERALAQLPQPLPQPL